MQRRPPQPAHPRAEVHPKSCRFCGGPDFWQISRGPVHRSGVDHDGRHFSVWEFVFTVRCMKCHATFNAASDNDVSDGDVLTWHLGRAL
jgi:hypothetical protein